MVRSHEKVNDVNDDDFYADMYSHEHLKVRNDL
jgi:hypothetical protein